MESTKWFEPEALAEVGCAKQWIAEAKSATSPVEVVFSSLLQKASILRDVHYTYIVDRSRTKMPPSSPSPFPRILLLSLSGLSGMRKYFGMSCWRLEWTCQISHHPALFMASRSG